MIRTKPVRHHRHAPSRWALALGLLAAWSVVGTARADLRFVEVGAVRGIEAYDAGPGFGAGIAAADFDDDGNVDFFVPNGPDTPDQLYRNRGDGSFEEMAAEAGVDALEAGRAALWLDFDGDGRLDLVVAGDCFSGGEACLDRVTLRFHHQEVAGGFRDVTAEMGLTEDGVLETGSHRAGLVAGDLNDDGWPDIVVGMWEGPALVLINDKGRGFIDISVASGIATATFHHWQPAIHDFDGDGWPDIYWAADFTANRFWHNQRDGTFLDIAPGLGLDNAMNDMGLVLGDYDNDGDFDVYVTEIFEFENHNVLFRNDSVGAALAFTEVAVEAGVENTGFGWGTTFFDADNDGWLDLAVTNGWFNGLGFEDQSRFFRNLGTDPVRFLEQASEIGLDDTEWGVALVAVDTDRDGDLDLIQTCNVGGPLRLLENQGTKLGHHLVIRPRTDGPNTRAIGAVVRAEVGAATMTRLVTAGTSHLGQEPAEAFFGLGAATSVDRLVIAWPDGAQTIRRDLVADQVLTIRRSPCPGTADLDGDGLIGPADLGILLAAWGPCPTRCPHDINENGRVGMEDVLALFLRWGPCG